MLALLHVQIELKACRNYRVIEDEKVKPDTRQEGAHNTAQDNIIYISTEL